VQAAVEIDSKAQETYRLNHPEVKLYSTDIRALDASAVLHDIGLRPRELDLLAGCPPCQGFSRLRTKNKKIIADDDRNELISDFMRFVRVIMPKTVMLENVPALGTDARFTEVLRELSTLGYSFVVDVLNAAEYAVPQRRKRLIMLASRVHSPKIAEVVVGRVTVRDALSSLERPKHSKDELHAMPEQRTQAVRTLIKRIPKDGGSRRDLGIKHQLGCHHRTNGFYDVYGRMAWDDVAPTITSGCHNPSKGRFLHPALNRNITLREASLLQGFPPDYRFDVRHGKEAIARMIGNALPPPFIEAHAIALLRGMEPFEENREQNPATFSSPAANFDC